mmetsp:Transcript_12041/g.26249  ORF Transcript_12041/g.26249 Transcript_12041/m.26249 type:complete len:252 (-) Transcript_12041:8-763(-)
MMYSKKTQPAAPSAPLGEPPSSPLECLHATHATHAAHTTGVPTCRGSAPSSSAHTTGAAAAHHLHGHLHHGRIVHHGTKWVAATPTAHASHSTHPAHSAHAAHAGHTSHAAHACASSCWRSGARGGGGRWCRCGGGRSGRRGRRWGCGRSGFHDVHDVAVLHLVGLKGLGILQNLALEDDFHLRGLDAGLFGRQILHIENCERRIQIKGESGSAGARHLEAYADGHDFFSERLLQRFASPLRDSNSEFRWP